jgi:hypothetical protein
MAKKTTRSTLSAEALQLKNELLEVCEEAAGHEPEELEAAAAESCSLLIRALCNEVALPGIPIAGTNLVLMVRLGMHFDEDVPRQ